MKIEIIIWVFVNIENKNRFCKISLYINITTKTNYYENNENLLKWFMFPISVLTIVNQIYSRFY